MVACTLVTLRGAAAIDAQTELITQLSELAAEVPASAHKELRLRGTQGAVLHASCVSMSNVILR